MVRVKVKLEILSKQDLKDLENDVMRLEKLAGRKDRATQKIAKRREKPRGGIFGQEEADGSLPSAILKKRRKTLTDRLEDSKFASQVKAKDKTSAQAIKKTSWAQEKEKQIDALQKGLKNTQGSVAKISQVIDNPSQLIIRGITKNKGGVAVVIIAAISVFITELMRRFFGPDGPGDIRKQIKDEVATIFRLDHIVDIRAGRTFFTADLRVRSGAVNNSISSNLGEDSMLYRQFNVGRDILS